MTARIQALNIAAGGALGFTIGALAGMAVSPVVGAVIGTLATAGVAFLTLRHEDSKPEILLRVTAFGLVLPLAAILGVYIRANNVLGLTPKRFIAQLEDARISHEDAVKLYFQRAMAESAPAREDKANDTQASRESTVNSGVGGLFGSPSTRRKELLDALHKNSDWEQTSNNVQLIAPEWLNTVQAIDMMSLSPKDKKSLLTAIVAQP
jgi:hypothetical protein